MDGFLAKEEKHIMYYELFSPGTLQKWCDEAQYIIDRYNKTEKIRTGKQ